MPSDRHARIIKTTPSTQQPWRSSGMKQELVARQQAWGASGGARHLNAENGIVLQVPRTHAFVYEINPALGLRTYIVEVQK